MPSDLFPVQLYSIDYRTHEQAFISHPHRHTVVEIFYFIGGEGTHYIDFAAYPIGANAVFLIAPQQMHYIEAPAHSHNLGFVVAFDTEFFNLLEPDFRALFGSFNQSPAYQLPETAGELLRPALAQLADELKAQRPRKGLMIKLLLNLLLTFVLRAKQSAPTVGGSGRSGANEAVDRFIACLEANYGQLHSVTAYAERLAMTPRQLNRICRLVRGQSALGVIHERIGLEAKRMLFYSAEPIKEIAYRLGFVEPAHFTHFFRRQTGLAPEAFRVRMAQIRK